MRMCWNWKVLGGLAVVGLGIYLVAPGVALAVAPFLLQAACPLSMLLMMRGMGGQCTTTPQAQPTAVPAGSREEQLVQLRRQLEDVQAQQATLAGRIAELQAAERPSKALQEAEQAAAARPLAATGAR